MLDRVIGGVCAALLAALAIFYLTQILESLYDKPNRSAHYARDYKASSEPPGIAVEKADDRIADYTWWLTLITAALVVVSLFQGCILILSNRTAAAGVALAKDEFVATHRPVMRVRGVKLLEGVKIGYVVANIGQTKAIITRHNLSMVYKHSKEVGVQKIYPVANPGYICLESGASQNIVADIGTYDLAWGLFNGAFIKGVIEYEDGIGIKRHTAFAARYCTGDGFIRTKDSEEEYED
jgi:hypothetical protein